MSINQMFVILLGAIIVLRLINLAETYVVASFKRNERRSDEEDTDDTDD